MNNEFAINDRVMIKNLHGKVGKILETRQTNSASDYMIGLSAFDHDVAQGTIPAIIQKNKKDLVKVYSTGDRVIIRESKLIPLEKVGELATVVCRKYSPCLDKYLYTICLNRTGEYFTDVNDDAFVSLYIKYNVEPKNKNNFISLEIDKIIFSDVKTIVLWKDGTKTIVSCMDGDKYDYYNGFCAALAKRVFGSTANAQKLMSEKAFNDPDWYKEAEKSCNKNEELMK